jgi:hypothetical protein
MGSGDLYQIQFAAPNQQYQNQFAVPNQQYQKAQAAGPALPARRSLDDQALLHREVSQMLRKVSSLPNVFSAVECILLC